MAGSAAGWVVVTSLLLDLPLDWYLVGLAFVLALGFYTRDRLDEDEQDTDMTTMPARTRWIQSHGAHLHHFVKVNFFLAIIIIMMRPAAWLPILAGLGFALTYTVRWLPWQGKKVGWKHLPGMKMPFVAILWTILTVITPIMVYGMQWDAKSGQVMASVCLLIMIQILINDLRDLTGDQQHGTYSLPVLVGDASSRHIGYVLACLAALCASIFSPLSVIALYSAFLLWRYQPRMDEKWRFWIEIQGIVAGLCVGFYNM